VQHDYGVLLSLHVTDMC